MTSYAIMFNALEGGVIEPIEWSKDQLQPDRSIIVLDESTMAVYLWHGKKQGLVARRTALRQAESLKGHGYTIGKSIIGRDVKELKEIDARKVGRVPEETELNEELQELLDRKHKKLNNYAITFDMEAPPPSAAKPEPKPQAKPEIKPAPKPEIKKETISEPKPKPTPKHTPEQKSKPTKKLEPEIKPKSTSTAKPAAKSEIKKEVTLDLTTQAKVAFVFISILDHYDDIWISRKDTETFSVEMMDGPICTFSISNGSLKFSSGSFSGISKDIKTEIQKKFVELNKLIQ